MKVVFMGTSQFAVPALEMLVQSSHELAAIYTKCNASNSKSPVYSALEKLGATISVFQPRNFKSEQDVSAFQKLKPDVAVVAAYGIILPKIILDTPQHGVLNIHPSKLPRWRGAAPVERAIMSGDTDTAVCIMQMDTGLDTGAIILQEPHSIDDNITGTVLSESLARQGAKMLLEVLKNIEDGRMISSPQNTMGVTYAHKIEREDEKISWSKTARIIHRTIRALSPKPGAHFVYQDQRIKVLAAEYSDTLHDRTPGSILSERLEIACIEGILKPTLLQRESRKVMSTAEFLMGCKIPIGTILV
ncbi:methionyl-tRNA formyltransferase [Rickettsiales endosymbiont of Peranema trichophorum]|uniref:methionyl-tRNA formyltransferase n=1 Tax=Rickettsiales endosymbiont of Peranema trichophorum TaxID=2486577 RepID=UPI001023ACDE|nr:methionyl-tRNA formyltransferase [Rickettsiales endosymbiont of Peranema trichophorum]RZI47651.1 methionyl-tRNA formyltransferase [Rickettsiales endosymbiont of Peranema trichophorum]